VSSRRRHTRFSRDWSSDVCSSDLIDDAVWAEFATNVSYCQGDISDPSAYKKLADRLASFSNDKLRRNLLFYLATSPSQFGEVVEHLYQTGLLRKEVASEPDQRVVVKRSEEHTSELQSRENLVCRLLLEKKKK